MAFLTWALAGDKKMQAERTYTAGGSDTAPALEHTGFVRRQSAHSVFKLHRLFTALGTPAPGKVCSGEPASVDPNELI
jgi:hypothetical protein